MSRLDLTRLSIRTQNSRSLQFPVFDESNTPAVREESKLTLDIRFSFA
jgi:hypothetical protein